MPKPRKQLISTETTPYYHCVSRCVRRSFLCGSDGRGNDFEHRRQWIEDRLLALADIFAVDVCAYAIMSNHYHVVLHIDAPEAACWSKFEVVTRWHMLFKGNIFSQKFIRGQSLSNIEQALLDEIVTGWRERLHDISWFIP